VRLERLGQLKNPVTSSGIEPATLRLVSYCLSQLRYRVPPVFFNTWENYFCQLLNVHEIRDVRQMKIHADEPLVPEPGTFEVGVAVAKLRTGKSPGTNRIPKK
jgi:hypothetical protein